jgi:hypothetical protein
MKNDFRMNIVVSETNISVEHFGDADYISLTDLAKYVNPDDPSGVIRNWMSNKNSFDFYGLWEELNNENFNSVAFHGIKLNEAPYNRFTMTPTRWRKEFNAIGIIPGNGKYSTGTFAHPDIAFEFASWLSPEFKLYLIKEFERLRISESYQYKVKWRANRELAKANYVVHTDAIKENIIPNLSEKQQKMAYANEADVLNVALFGMTAKEWRKNNSELAKSGQNIRDAADLLHLIILSNLENINAELINSGISQSERLLRLNKTAKKQIRILANNKSIKNLEQLESDFNSTNLHGIKQKRLQEVKNETTL